MNGEPMTTIDSLERFLEVQLQTWKRRDEEQKCKRVGPVIAITRQPGCDGESIAQTLAEELGLVLYDWKIVEEIAKDAQVSEQVVATLDEKLCSELGDWLDGFTGGPNLSSDQYMQCLRKVLFTVATHGNAVLLGRGANFLLPPEKRTLGLCLVAPLDVRVENIMQKRHLSEKDAQEHIVRTERERRLWVKEQGHADITDATNYHIVINTALVATETIVQIVKGIVKARS
jgi:cytidylate kinase